MTSVLNKVRAQSLVDVVAERIEAAIISGDLAPGSKLSELASLALLLKQHERQKSVQEGTGYYQEPLDFDFHFQIIKGSRSERLDQMLCGNLYYLLRVYRYKSSTKPGRAMKALQEHKQILAALTRRDPVAAEQKMRQHLQNARAFVEEELKRDAAKASLAKPSAGNTRRTKAR